MILTICHVNDIGSRVTSNPAEPPFYVHIISASTLGHWLLRACEDLLPGALTSVPVVFQGSISPGPGEGLGLGSGGREVPGGLESGLNWEMEVRECQERARLGE